MIVHKNRLKELLSPFDDKQLLSFLDQCRMTQLGRELQKISKTVFEDSSNTKQSIIKDIEYELLNIISIRFRKMINNKVNHLTK